MRTISMKRLAFAFATICILTATAANGAGHGRGHDDHDRGGPPGLANKPDRVPPGQAKQMWRRGERLPALYIGPKYFVQEPRAYRLALARPGHRWVVVDGDAYLIELATGLVADTVFGVSAVNYGPPSP